MSADTPRVLVDRAEIERLRARIAALVTPEDMREHIRTTVADRAAPYDVNAIVRDLIAELGPIDLTDPHHTNSAVVREVVERHELDPARLCVWCDQPMPVGSNRNRRTCSSACRQRQARWEREQAETESAS